MPFKAKPITTEKAGKERRLQPRRKIDDYPLSIRKPNGVKIKAHMSNISAMGFQIRCSRLSANILTGRKIGIFENRNLPDVEVIVVLPYKNGIKKINSLCKIRYAALSEEVNPILAITIGLQVIKHKTKSFEVIREILYGCLLPRLKTGKSRVLKTQTDIK